MQVLDAHLDSLKTVDVNLLWKGACKISFVAMLPRAKQIHPHASCVYSAYSLSAAAMQGLGMLSRTK